MKKIVFAVLMAATMASFTGCMVPMYSNGTKSFYAPIAQDFGYNNVNYYGRSQTLGQTLVRLVLVTGSYIVAAAVENALYTNNGYGYQVFCSTNQLNQRSYYCQNSNKIAFPVYLWSDGRFYGAPEGPTSFYAPIHQASAVLQTLNTEYGHSVALGGRP
jgi:hypothetical protein